MPILLNIRVNSNFRKLALQALASQARIKEPTLDVKASLTSLVQESLQGEPSNFREKFLSMKPGPERERFIFQEIIKRRPIGQLRPVTVPGPKGIKLTYYVMPDFITIDGIRVPMSGQTAQKVADHFGMYLPTIKQSKQIWESADVKMRPQPLSSGGRIGGKHYTGEEVVRSKISDSDAAVAYSDMIQQELEHRGGGNLIAGHMKDIVAPLNPDKLGLYGWYGESGEPLEQSKVTGHDTKIHSEYGTGARLVSNKVVVQLPDGRKAQTTMDQVLNHPVVSKYVSEAPGVRKYNLT